MWKYLLRRTGASLVLLFVVATILFFSIHLLPGDPVLLILGGDTAQPTPEQIATVRAKLQHHHDGGGEAIVGGLVAVREVDLAIPRGSSPPPKK